MRSLVLHTKVTSTTNNLCPLNHELKNGLLLPPYFDEWRFVGLTLRKREDLLVIRIPLLGLLPNQSRQIAEIEYPGVSESQPVNRDQRP